MPSRCRRYGLAVARAVAVSVPEPGFGSCRTTAPHDQAHLISHGVDILRSQAYELSRGGDVQWPSLLLLLGDQVYADEPPPHMVEMIERRRPDEGAGKEVADFRSSA